MGALAIGAVALVAILARTDTPAPDTGHSPMVAVSVPTLDAAETRGAALFATHCQSCHGADGAGRAGVGPPLVHVIYEPGHHPDGAFHAAVQLGVRAHHWDFGDMPRLPDLSEPQIASIIAYVRALQRANGIF